MRFTCRLLFVTGVLALITIDGAAQENLCQNVNGHIDGQIVGPSALCGGGVTEIGTFTGAGGGTFVACITGIRTNGSGTIFFDLAHTYTTTAGDTFTTTDRV